MKSEKPGKKRLLLPAALLVLVLIVIVILLILKIPREASESFAFTITQAEYPQMAPYPDESADFDAFSEAYDAWLNDRYTQRQQPEGYKDGFDCFFSASIPQFLAGSGEENLICSPLNIYMALSMLAELTDGNSRSQILDLLGVGTMTELRTKASALWNANYCNDGAVTSILANSLWLNETVHYNESVMDTLANTYYASSYRGEMGSEEYNRALQDWLNEQTGGLLEDQVSDITMDAETILTLASSIYFRAKWNREFMENMTGPELFHASSGDMTCDFMHQSDSRTYYWGKHFSAVEQSFEGGGSMWFLLPDEGYTPRNLLEDPQVTGFILSPYDWENSEYRMVHLSVPKFDVTSSTDLIEGLMALGITDVFDPAVSDFSPMTQDTEEIYISKALHDARVIIDEEGCTATAYTVMMMKDGAAPPADEEIYFTLDRPFLFVITGTDGLPLFAGVVNQP